MCRSNDTNLSLKYFFVILSFIPLVFGFAITRNETFNVDGFRTEVISASDTKKVESECATSLTPELIEEIKENQHIVDKITNAIVRGQYSGDTWNALAEMTDKFGSRMTGSQSLENAIDYMVDELKKAGLDNVHTENATVPHWERGYESCRMVSPRQAKIAITGFGSSVGTLGDGLIADVVVVESFEEFDKLPAATVQGKIVSFVPEWRGYFETVIVRIQAASVASKKGAVAALVRSMTPYSTLHTGWQEYGNDVKNKIPAAAVTVEDAYMMLRMYRRGEKITLHLEMDDKNLDDFVSRNTIAELAGETKAPVVVVSGHLDSWDLGVGAMDDGGGAFIAWKALHLLKRLNLKPKRTIRAILWTAEEQGLYGAQEYERQHKSHEKEEFNFFIESDAGTFTPLGLDFSGNKEAECIFREVLKLMAPLNATQFNSPTGAGPDIRQWSNRGFPAASLMNKNDKYFYYHHSAADSMLLENSDDLDKNTALFASVAYVIANLSVDMPKDVKN
ncbi:carboxypeptidase Q-like [Contarinia nasturtii]|uniref:carboxypeptidase Q-like n=1 Tax=Contarinia nasturtii TaxID=265458 RepID=UPI0012D3B2D9|nr:carboxypeptidase Q-like [Contarinia nasturtii]